MLEDEAPDGAPTVAEIVAEVDSTSSRNSQLEERSRAHESRVDARLDEVTRSLVRIEGLLRQPVPVASLWAIGNQQQQEEAQSKSDHDVKGERVIFYASREGREILFPPFVVSCVFGMTMNE